MMVWKYMFESYDDQVGKASPEQKEGLEKEILALREWGERRVASVRDVPFKESEKCMVYDVDGKPIEVMVPRVSWDLEDANPELLPDIDRRIADAYRAMKKIGFEQPSTLLYCRMFSYLHNGELSSYYEGKVRLFASVALVLKRLESTCRIALRYRYPDKFGSVKVVGDDGSVQYQLKSEVLERELIFRGVMRPKR